MSDEEDVSASEPTRPASLDLPSQHGNSPSSQIGRLTPAFSTPDLSSSASTPDFSEVKKYGANYNERQRGWIFYCLAVSRTELGFPHDDDSVGVKLYSKLVEVLDFLTPPHPSCADLKPSQTAVRNLWKAYKTVGKVAKDAKGGRPKHSARAVIEEAFDDSTVSSLRETANELKLLLELDSLSYGLIRKVAKEKQHYFHQTKSQRQNAITARKEATTKTCAERRNGTSKVHQRKNLRSLKLLW